MTLPYAVRFFISFLTLICLFKYFFCIHESHIKTWSQLGRNIKLNSCQFRQLIVFELTDKIRIKNCRA